MKKLLFIVFITFSISLSAQVTNKGDVKISSGTTFYIEGVDFINDNAGHTWSNDGQVIFKGDNFTNNGTMDATATGTTEFSGTNEQNIKGTQTANFHNLNINNANNSVVQQSIVETDNMSVSDGAKDFDYKVSTDKALTVNDALTSNGDIRLKGTSQLVQTHSGVTSNSGSKYIWIDQQGTTNQYWYNYWSAPVNQSGVWKVKYLRDGAQGDDTQKLTYPQIDIADNTNATGDITNAGGAHPVTLNAYWMYAFKDGTDGTYQGWYDNHIKQNGSVNPGEGYTMKGPGVDANLNAANGALTTEYNSWTFAGSPNDGDYSVTISSDHDYLIGNPYPSAFDADAFIKAHVTSANGGTSATDIFNGTLYFWEHTGGNDHFGRNYQGGYATYTLAGGVKATDWQGTGTTVGTKEPKRYIPVGQGFTIWAEAGQGGTVNFKNAFRYFETEGANSVFMRPQILTDIRLGFDTPLQYHRQLLLAVRNNTTNGIDAGWDGPNFDSDHPGADAFWNLNNRDFVIEAVPDIDVDSRFPLNVELIQEGLVNFQIDEARNLPAGINDIYIEDTFNNTSHRINNGDNYEVFLQQGNYDGRFFMTFAPTGVSNLDEVQLENIASYYDNNNAELVILNSKNHNISDVKLYALTGQEILSDHQATDKAEIRIPANLTTGVYLINVTDIENKVYAAKLIVK